MILVIDGNNLANMCFYVGRKLDKQLINSDGLNVTMTDVFMKRLYKFYDTLYPDKIIIAWDKKINKGFKNFRKDDGTYKANRSDDNEDLFKQCDIIESMVQHLGIRNIHPNVMEADDVIAWIAHTATEKILIASFDKDLLQLINHNVEYFDMRQKQRITVQNFEQFNDIRRNRFLLYKMVLGDKSDNIDGLKGYGKVKSKRIAESDSPLADLTLEQKQILAKNKKLMDLSVGYMEYPDEVPIYQKQFNTTPERNFNKFLALASANNIQYVKDYKWKWEDLCLNT